MLPRHIKDYINDRFMVEDIIYELDLTTEELINALDKAGHNLKIFEALYVADNHMQMELFEDEQD